MGPLGLERPQPLHDPPPERGLGRLPSAGDGERLVRHLLGDDRARRHHGAGTIVCNYDGVFKHHTEIGARAFIGSNTALVAPVSIGARALVAAGSVITADVPDGALAVARGRQSVKPGVGARIMERLRALKPGKASA